MEFILDFTCLLVVFRLKEGKLEEKTKKVKMGKIRRKDQKEKTKRSKPNKNMVKKRYEKHKVAKIGAAPRR